MSGKRRNDRPPHPGNSVDNVSSVPAGRQKCGKGTAGGGGGVASVLP